MCRRRRSPTIGAQAAEQGEGARCVRRERTRDRRDAMTGRPIRGITGALVAGALLVALTTASAQMLTGLKAAEPQPAADRLQPGLAAGTSTGASTINEFMTKKFEPGSPCRTSTTGWGRRRSHDKRADQVGAPSRASSDSRRWDLRLRRDLQRRRAGGDRRKLLYEDPSVHWTTRRTGSTSRSTSRAGTRSRSCTTRRRVPPRLCSAGCRSGATPRPSLLRCRPAAFAQPAAAPWAVAVLPVEGVGGVEPEV